MGDLLSSVLEAHGSLEQWRSLKSGAAAIVSGGELLDRKAPHRSRRSTFPVCF